MLRKTAVTVIILAASTMVSGCYSCSLNGGWERQMNPFCVESKSLVPLKTVGGGQVIIRHQ
jgi:hypothetical protein